MIALACREGQIVGPSTPHGQPGSVDIKTPPLPQIHVITQPLGVIGNRFTVPLKMVVICCYDSYTLAHGWPLIDKAALEEIALAGGNATHVRPTTMNAPWSALAETIRNAQNLGIYVEVDVVDNWALRTGNGPWPNQGCEITHEAPREQHLRWVRDLVAASGSYPNVIYLVGNEAFTCDAGPEWELGIKDAIHDAEKENNFDHHLVGTNSERADLEPEFDYYTIHSEFAAPRGPKPRLVNETKDSLVNPEDYRLNLQAACREGTYIALWRGLMNDGQWAQAKSYLKEFQCKR